MSKLREDPLRWSGPGPIPPPPPPPPASNNGDDNDDDQKKKKNKSRGGGGGGGGGISSAAYSPADTHLKTYTAGEDTSRLAAAAKELGLQKARMPRRQVRGKQRPQQYAGLPLSGVISSLFDPSTEDARMRAVYSRSSHFSDEEMNIFYSQRHFELPDAIAEEQGEAEPEMFDDGHGAVGGDLTSAVLGIIKGMVGPAILYLPHGFASAGYVVALPIMVLCTALFLYSSSCLLDSWKLESNKNSNDEGSGLLGRSNQKQFLSYPELAYRALGERGETMVKIGIALMQSGVCLTYLIFVPQNLHASFKLLTGIDVSLNIWLVVMILFQIPLSWIRDIRRLTPTNLLANVLILYGLLTCLYFAIREASRMTHGVGGPIAEIWYNLTHLDPFASEWYLFIGTSVLLFEGSITLLVPLQEAVITEEQRAQFPAVYTRVILCVIVFYAFFGITCWMAFGNDVRTVLTTSLPAGVLATTVQLAYSIAVIFTFPLQNFPALEIACRSISHALTTRKIVGRDSILTRRNVLSSLLVAMLAVVAVCTMESLDKVVSLMGSLLGCPIAFVFPPLIHSRLEPNLTPTRLWLNRFVILMGLVAMAYSSFTTIVTW